jgi:hypothetical protein
VASYDVFVSVNGGAFSSWLTQTTATSATYDGQPGDTVAFYSVAHDNVGLVQPTPSKPDTTTIVGSENVGPFSAWAAAKFGSAYGDPKTQATLWGHNADPDGDGISNLLEYAFGLDPKTPSRNGLPIVGLATRSEDGMTYLTLTYSTPVYATGLTFIPQISTNLVNWQSGPNATAVVSDTIANGIRTVVIRDITPASGNTRRFIRVLVEATN